jgi:hypothetical protein
MIDDAIVKQLIGSRSFRMSEDEPPDYSNEKIEALSIGSVLDSQVWHGVSGLQIYVRSGYPTLCVKM